ncbi:alpha-amylase family glycosyl hydrolase [Salsipaludibacter albus]|uniref:alpha-amylase family glycosyl hydrolase n=1 Tax=Salsipaludibacter albus TaxID=2849650 RepID=UPI001EE48C01|nr:alpha-amylase family glycosyl hydrolase [Salsipaludibacter albus]
MTGDDSHPATEGSEHRGGMGAIVHDEGVAFRVWAPNASAAWVVGDFDDWGGTELVSEGNGYFYGDVAGASAGDEYKFRLTGADGDERYRIDPYARHVTNSVGNGIVHDPAAFDWGDDDFACPSHDQLVVYETHVGSFVGGPGGPGDLEKVAGKLAYLADVGINAIELMPLMEFSGDVSWGYNPAHVFAVESAYGGPDALKGFVKAAHEHGIAVILDVVYNHFGPSDLDLWRFDGWSEHDKGGIYFYNDHRSATPWGDTRPDYGREAVRNFIHDNAFMWLREYRVDGLRFDMTPFMRSVDGTGKDIPEGWDLMGWIARDVRDQFPDAIMIAEDLHGDHLVTSTASDGAAFHSQWDTHFVHPVRRALTAVDDDDRSMTAVADAITYDYGDAFARVVYTESHDEVANGKARIPSEVDGDNPTGWHAQKRAALGLALVLTSPGIPMLFQGQEFLEDEWFRDDVPLDWPRAEHFRDLVRMVSDLVHLRRDVDGTSGGLRGQDTRLLQVDDDAKVVAFSRHREDAADVVVIANFQAESVDGHRVGFPAAGHWSLRFNSDARTYSSLFGDHGSGDLDVGDDGVDGLPASAVVDIGPASVLVYTRD